MRGVAAPMKDATFGEMPCAVVERVPRNVVLDVRLLLHHFGAHIVGERAHGLAFAEDFEGDSLQQVAEAAAIGKEPLVA
jgi:hypothetical protein